MRIGLLIIFSNYNISSKGVLLKPILTKHFTNQTVHVGENVTLTCEAQIDALPLFFFYKLDSSICSAYNAKKNVDLLDEYALALQDQQNLFNDFATVDPKYALLRRPHVLDSNKDPLSDLETVSLHVLNVTKEDSAFYLCIVANSLKSFRVTYSYLTVIDAVKTWPTSASANISSSENNIFSREFENYFARNKFLIFSISCSMIVVVLIVALTICYCCLQYMRTQRLKDKFKYTVKTARNLGDNVPGSKMNALLERTMSTMRKNFVYSSMTPNAFDPTQVSSSSLSTNSSTLNSQHCAAYEPNNLFSNSCAINENENERISIHVDLQWEFQKEK